ncbi:MAG: methyltransferase domain-containing protein [Candidatus Woesearchaeota archaeon]|jgi:tRNA (adenine57-N1/adenine58-N1)-methyltransferase|nr:methyltransferase domain-containing protein [Candidatus Woesearchaeota archaeon]MDP7324150.1 methyltransferase domain-containing protein [Candidatus Woesearchaeota archaeon]
MSKILINKAKKEFIKDINREVTVRKGEMYVIKDTTQDFHTTHGIVAKKDLKKNGILQTSQKKEFSLFDADFIDNYKQIERAAQIPLLKDITNIIAFTGINKKSIVIDAGAGSGGISLFLANYAKEVITYDIKKEAVTLVKKNAKFLGLTNIKVKEKDIYKGFDEKNVDLVTIDLPSPWNVIGSVDNALKVGGFLVSYSPQITQSLDFVNVINKHGNFIAFKTAEIMERTWDLDNRKCRPNSRVQHSGFLTFCRKIK